MTRSKTFPARFEVVAEICEFAGQEAQRLGYDADTVFRIQLACDEACTNIIEHGYAGAHPDEARLWVEVSHDAEFYILTIRDGGRVFDPTAVPAPPAYNPDDLENLQVGGLGLHFIHAIMDEVAYHIQPAAADLPGNTLILKKKLPARDT